MKLFGVGIFTSKSGKWARTNFLILSPSRTPVGRGSTTWSPASSCSSLSSVWSSGFPHKAIEEHTERKNRKKIENETVNPQKSTHHSVYLMNKFLQENIRGKKRYRTLIRRMYHHDPIEVWRVLFGLSVKMWKRTGLKIGIPWGPIQNCGTQSIIILYSYDTYMSKEAVWILKYTHVFQ